MNIIVHRGSNQIGGTCIEVYTEKTRIILDVGEELPGLDGSIDDNSKRPKVRGLFEGDKRSVDGLLISHGHGDHLGLINDINEEIPVYIGEKAACIYNMTAEFTGGRTISNALVFLKSGIKFNIGDFQITPYLVDHSGFDSYAFLIEYNNKSIVYTGDFRNHGRKKAATDYFMASIPKNIDALLVEGTMMSRINETVKTEEELEKQAYKIMESNLKPVFILQSSTNIDRLVSMYRASKRSGRIFVMDIFTANIVSQLNSSIPNPRTFKDVRVFYPFYLTKKMFEKDGGPKLMNRFSYKRISREELSKMDNYSMLIRESMKSDMDYIGDISGSSLIYSKWSGYKEDPKTKKMLRHLESKNIKIVDLHTSGHASLEAINNLVENSKPKKIIPIHTERPDLFVDKFDNVHIGQDGNIISL